MRRSIVLAFALALATAAAPLQAESPPAGPAAPALQATAELPRLAGPVRPFVRGHEELRRRVERDRGFRGIDQAQKDAFYAAQDAVITMLSGVERFEDITPEAKPRFHDALLDLVAAQQVVVGQQLVCRRMRTVGSQIPENVCLTRDQILARNDETGDTMRKHLQLQQADYCQIGVCLR
ncbi:hypothetical protein [Silanimonas algicola]